MHTFRFMGKKRLKCSQRHILPVSGISGWREQMAAGQRRDIQERRSWTGETQRPKKGNNQRHGDSESIRRRASPTQCSPRERDRERERANPSEPVAVVREQLTSPTGRFYSPLLCVWDPPGWRGAEADWYWQGLCGRGRRAAGGWRRVKKVVMNQQLSLTKARHKNRVRPRQKHTRTHTHTHVRTSKRGRSHAIKSDVCVKQRWRVGERLQSEEGGLSKKWTNKTPENQIPLLLSRRHSETLSVQVMWL